MNKKYEYNGNIYCKDDLSNQIDNYGGDLYELFSELEADDRAESVVMFRSIDEDGEDGKYIYGSIEYCLEEEFNDLEVKENE